jgi:hypothetical protein
MSPQRNCCWKSYIPSYTAHGFYTGKIAGLLAWVAISALRSLIPFRGVRWRVREPGVYLTHDGADTHHGASLCDWRKPMLAIGNSRSDRLSSRVPRPASRCRCLVDRHDAMRAKDLRCSHYAQKRTSGLACSTCACANRRRAVLIQSPRPRARGTTAGS